MNGQIHSILKKYWGYNSFRPLQEEIIHAVLNGNDTLAVLPTGGGKSICFQVPALLKPGLCLVISPLIALMKDQVENLKKKGIPSLSLYSGMNFIEVKKTLQNAAYGNFKFLYVSPERLESSLFLEYLPALSINLVAVDEAHCISQWGYDFRPPYCRIASIREHLKEVPVLALTASATSEIRDDICEKLSFKPGNQRFLKSFERPNLSYSAFSPPSKENKLIEILTNVPGTAIVYCKSRKRTKEISDLLNLHKIRADFYHAGLTSITRSLKQEHWIQDQTRVIVSTNAFGMGIDKSDVRTVIHFDIPDSLESYYQEAGRAGRDEKKAYAVLLYREAELIDLERLSAIRFPEIEEVKKVYQSLANYLQLPTGVGEGIYYDIDLSDFVKKFHLEISKVVNSFKILEQEDLISYTENSFLPSTVEFTAGRNDLEELEKTDPALVPIIKGLLRSYHGIMDFPSPIAEKPLASFIGMDSELVRTGLMKLHLLKIIDYHPQKEKPQVVFLKNRVRNEELVFNTNNLLKRKRSFEGRVAAMLNFAKTTLCRSQAIGNYFTDAKMTKCGICDNCIQEQNRAPGTDEFKYISEKIQTLIRQMPLNAKDLHMQLSVPKTKFWKVLNFLQVENKVNIDPNGLISLIGTKKKGPR